MENKENSEIELLRYEIECLKSSNFFIRADLITLRETLNGVIKSTVKVSESLRDGLIEMENRVTDIEAKKGGI